MRIMLTLQSREKEGGIMNELQDWFENHEDRQIAKWTHYFDIYDKHLSRFKGKSPTILEIGVSQGGSLQMWKEYFGPGARVIGADFSKKCLELKDDGFEIVIGDQASKAFWDRVKVDIPKLDILIDDGGHRMDQQRVTFDEMFGHIKDDGVYLCEDVHTSYRPKWGGGYKHPESFIEFGKELIDVLNAWHSTEPEKLSLTPLTRAMNSIHFYDSVIVVEKTFRTKPFQKKSGKRRLGGEIIGETARTDQAADKTGAVSTE